MRAASWIDWKWLPKPRPGQREEGHRLARKVLCSKDSSKSATLKALSIRVIARPRGRAGSIVTMASTDVAEPDDDAPKRKRARTEGRRTAPRPGTRSAELQHGHELWRLRRRSRHQLLAVGVAAAAAGTAGAPPKPPATARRTVRAKPGAALVLRVQLKQRVASKDSAAAADARRRRAARAHCGAGVRLGAGSDASATPPPGEVFGAALLAKQARRRPARPRPRPCPRRRSRVENGEEEETRVFEARAKPCKRSRGAGRGRVRGRRRRRRHRRRCYFGLVRPCSPPASPLARAGSSPASASCACSLPNRPPTRHWPATAIGRVRSRHVGSMRREITRKVQPTSAAAPVAAKRQGKTEVGLTRSTANGESASHLPRRAKATDAEAPRC